MIHQLKDKYKDIEIKLKQIESTCCSKNLMEQNYDVLISSKNISIENKSNLTKKIVSCEDFGILIDKSSTLYEKYTISFNYLISLQLPIYTLDIYQKDLLEYLPQLKNNIKTEQNINLLFASGYLNKGIILTTYEESKILNPSNMCFKKIINLPINSTNYLYYLKDNSN